MAVRGLAVALAAGLAVLLGGCSYMPSGSTEDLLVAPKLNARQVEIEAALDATLDLSRIRYKYPQTGDFRSPFIFYDLNNDGKQEAIVFYAFIGDSSNTRAKMLREVEAGQWTTAFDISDLGEQIEFIQFASLLDPNEKCIIIGSQSVRRYSTLGVYSLAGETLRKELAEPYNAFVMEDFDNSGLSEIITAYKDSGEDRYTLSLYGKGLGGHLRRLDHLALVDAASSLLQILQGKLWDGSTGLYIDEEVDGSIWVTEIVSVQGGRLIPKATSESGEDIGSTRRPESDALWWCIDLDRDGVVEIPLNEPMPGQTDSADAAYELSVFWHLTGDGFAPVFRGVVNDQDGYAVIFPERWTDMVTVVSQPELRELQFCKFNKETGEAGSKLLRIRAYSTGDYQDKFTSDYMKLAENGPMIYYAYVPELADEPLAITEAEARLLFLLL